MALNWNNYHTYKHIRNMFELFLNNKPCQSILHIFKEYTQKSVNINSYFYCGILYIILFDIWKYHSLNEISWHLTKPRVAQLSLIDLVMQQCITIGAMLKEVHPRVIPVKFVNLGLFVRENKIIWILKFSYNSMQTCESKGAAVLHIVEKSSLINYGTKLWSSYILALILILFAL